MRSEVMQILDRIAEAILLAGRPNAIPPHEGVKRRRTGEKGWRGETVRSLEDEMVDQWIRDRFVLVLQ